MSSRVGFFLASPEASTASPHVLASLWQKLERVAKSDSQDILPLAFLSDEENLRFFQAFPPTQDGSAVVWSESGINYSDRLPASYRAPDTEIAESLGIRALLLHCHVVLVICEDEQALGEILHDLNYSTGGSDSLIACLDLKGARNQFFLVNHQFKELDEAVWLKEVKERWASVSADLPKDLKKPLFAKTFPVLASATMLEPYETQKKTDKDFLLGSVGSEALEMLTEPDGFRDGRFAAASTHHKVRDGLGTVYSDSFRSAAVLTPALIAISTFLAVAGYVYHHYHIVLHVLEGILLFLALYFFHITQKNRHQKRWVENRLLAEHLRPAALELLLGFGPRFGSIDSEWTEWSETARTYWNVVRQLPTQRWSTENDFLLSARRSAILNFCQKQAKWQRQFSLQNSKLHHRLVNWSMSFFVLTFLICIFAVIAALALHLPEIFAGTLACVSALMALVAFVCSLISHQLGFEAIAERATIAAEHYEHLIADIEHHRPPTRLNDVYLWGSRCLEIYVDEQRSWYRQTSKIGFHI